MPTSTDNGYGSYESFGKYRFLAEIGRGGMSEIYLTVTQGGLGGFQKLVVVKLLRRDLAEDDDFRRMFLDEARLAARLNHPNVVQTYDVGEDHGRYYLAMEYLEGQTFERVRRARNASKLFPLHMQIQMLSRVLSGLHYAHELADYDETPISIVHRDVTPSNILITYDGQVKLVDFGIAKVLDSVSHTRVGVLKGKARYMAPEQVAGTVIDRRADIYSVGVMLWEILAGKHIWGGLSETDILRRNVSVPALPSQVDPMLQQVCVKAMAHRPEDRYATAEALRGDLELYLAQNAIPSRERDIGAVVAELFGDERVRIHQIIDSQLKGSRPGTVLPALRDLRLTASGNSLFDTPVPASSPAGSGSNPQISFTGENLPRPASLQLLTRTRSLLALGGGAVVVGIAIGAFMVSRGHGGSGPVADGSKQAVAAASVAAAVVEPSRAASPEPARPSVRGVTDDAITLGMSAAFSGASRELGNRMKLGLETAFAAINESGGVAGRSLKLLALDDGYEGARALANVQELINERNVFAIIGDVGTPTTKEALPFVVSKRVIFFGAFTGSGILRRDPPDRYVLNYRASYEEETAKMVNYLIDVKKVPDRGIVVFAQNDSYGDAGFEGATKMLRRKGRDDTLLRVGYERNTLNVEDAVNKVVEYHNATIRVGNDAYRPRHPVKAIIMVATYKAAAKFIQKIHDRKVDAMFLNVSFVGSNSLSEELIELGPAYAQGVIVTQVVPHYESGATGVLRYREALKKFHPDQRADFVSLEGYVVGQLFAEGLRRAGRQLDTEKLVDAFEGIHDFDPGIGGTLSFGMSQHQASHKVWGTQLDDHGAFRSIDME
jgi:serine/threonine protein kinase/ABC-type branched-subunit amino acid transport system substrate-binding protein